MKKSIFLFFAALLFSASAWADWCGNSFITVNGLWCTGSNSYVHEGGKFHEKDLGTLTTLELGGEFQVWPSSTTAGTLCYKIDDGTENSISLPKTGTDGNNSKHSGSGAVDLSGLAEGSHSIAVWFKHGSDIDNNGGSNFVATFTIAAAGEEPEPVADVTVHFINSVEWAAVACHHWIPGGAGTSWPGDVLSKTDEIAGYDVYTATFTGEHTSCIFNNNNNGNQTGDLTVEDGKYYEVNTNTWYADKATAEAALAIPIPDETVYLINTGNWSKVMIHTWNGVGGTAWPGVEMTPTGETIEGYDVYSYTAKQGGQANLLFQESADVNKTGDLEWNAGKYYAPLKNKWYDTKEDAAEALAAPVEYEYVYLINTNDWAKAYIYTWTPEVAGWPGAAMTKEATQIAGKDVYSYKVVKGTTFGGLNFNCGGDECKTGDLTWNAGKYYAPSTSDWYADAATAEEALAAVVTYDYYITGSFNGDNPKKAENGMTLDGTVYKATVTLAEGDNTLKVTDGTWDNTWGYGELGAAYEEVSNPNDYNNIKITLAAEKEITVIFDATAGKITFEGLITVETETLVYTVEVPEGTEDCYIAGQMNDWEFERMTQVNATQWTITYDNVLKTTEYKYACQADWAYAEVIDGGGNRTNWSELDEVTAWNKPVVYTYYLMGVNGDWTNGIEMEVNTSAENEVMLTCQPVNGEVKIKRLGDDESVSWFGGKSLKDEPGNLGSNTEAATDGDGNIALEEGIYNFYFNTADGKLWIAAATDCETEPEYFVVEEVITNFVFDLEAWPMVCMGGPSTPYQVEVYLTLTEDADGTLAYEDCSVSLMGTDATFIDGTLSNIDPYAPSADAVLHVLWQEEYYELRLSMSAVGSAAPVDVMAADATVTFSDNEGALKFNGTNVYDDDAVYVELAGFEYNGADEYTLNGAQISMFENTDAFAFADEVTVAIDEDGYITVEGVYTSFNGGGIYNVHIWGALPKYTLTLSSDVSDATLTGSDTYYATQEVTVTATQELPGWVFDHWSDGDEKVSTDATYTFRIGKDLELTANYLEIYTRAVTENQWGTICLPNASSSFTGATFYEVSSLDPAKGLWLDQLAAGAQLEAGKPYIFQATATEITVTYTDAAAVDAPQAGENGLTGTFTDIAAAEDGVLVGNYIIAQNAVHVATASNDLPANRAYINASVVPSKAQAVIPGRRRVCMGENATTGFDQIVAPAGQAVKAIENGQLIIIRDGVKYNVQGQVIR